MKAFKQLFWGAGLLGLSLAAQAQTIAGNQMPAPGRTPNDALVTWNSQLPSGIYRSGIIFIADQLERNIDPTEKSKATVVTSIASLDNLSETSAFGRLVAEHLMHELYVRGWQVNDIRLARELVINADGELGMSRDIKRLRSSIPAANIVTGSYTVSADGVLLSVRVVDYITGQVISSAETRLKGDAFLAGLVRQPRQAPQVKLSN